MSENELNYYCCVFWFKVSYPKLDIKLKMMIIH